MPLMNLVRINDYVCTVLNRPEMPIPTVLSQQRDACLMGYLGD